jgi:hypothetical protein
MAAITGRGSTVLNGMQADFGAFEKDTNTACLNSPRGGQSS